MWRTECRCLWCCHDCFQLMKLWASIVYLGTTPPWGPRWGIFLISTLCRHRTGQTLPHPALMAQECEWLLPQGLHIYFQGDKDPGKAAFLQPRPWWPGQGHAGEESRSDSSSVTPAHAHPAPRLSPAAPQSVPPLPDPESTSMDFLSIL